MECYHSKQINKQKTYQKLMDIKRQSIDLSHKQICLAKNCFKVLNREQRIEHVFSHDSHCISLDMSNGVIYCDQCEREVGDQGSGEYSYFHLRRLLLKKESQSQVLEQFQNFDKFQNLFQVSLLTLYNVEYLRKTFEKKYMSGVIASSKYGIELDSECIQNLSKGFFSLFKEQSDGDSINRLYFNLIQKDPTLGLYSYQNFNEYFMKILRILHNETRQLKYQQKPINDQSKQDTVTEYSPLSEIFNGQIKQKNQCKICLGNFYTKNEFMMLHLESFSKQSKNYIKNNRKNYFKLLEDEICSKRNALFRTFEKFQCGVFDYIYDFLHRDEMEGLSGPGKFKFQKIKNFGLKKEQQKNTFYCENCMMDINASKKYSITEFPEVLLIGFGETRDLLDMKLEETLNLSYFLQEDKEGKSVVFTQNLIKINNTYDKNTFKEIYNDYVYELKCFIKRNEYSKFQVYYKEEQDWYCVDSLNKSKITTLDRNTNDTNQIIFCMYQKRQQYPQRKDNILKIISSQEKTTRNKTLLPHNLLNKFLYTSLKNNSPINSFCVHGKIKPLFEDIFQLRYQENRKKKIDFPLTHSQINQDLILKSAFIHPSFSVLKYISEGKDVPTNIYESINKNYNQPRQSVIKKDYFQMCRECEVSMKKFTLKRILHKSLIMSLLSVDSGKNFLIDQVWFNNYKMFLLTDINYDHQSRIFFNYDYLNEKINQNIGSFYEDFKMKYGNDEEIAKSEFVEINQNLFMALCQIYKVDQLVLLENNKINFYEERELMSMVDPLILNYEQQFILSLILKEEYDERVYSEMLSLNQKINSLLDFQILTKYPLLKLENDSHSPKTLKEKVNTIFKLFQTKNIDKIDFNPCQQVFNVFSKLNPQLIKKRQTYVLDREKSQKQKNKNGYRKTIANLIQRKQDNEDIQLVSIDQQVKKQYRAVEEQISQEINNNLFQEVNCHPQDFDNESFNDSQYTTSQIYSVENSNLYDSFLRTSQRQSGFIKQQPKFSLLMQNNDLNNVRKTGSFLKKMDHSSEIDSEESLLIDIDNQIKEESQENSSDEDIGDNMFNWIDEDIKRSQSLNNDFKNSLSVKKQSEEDSLKRSYFAQINQEESSEEQSQQSIHEDQQIDLRLLKKISKDNMNLLMNRSEGIYKKVKELNQRNPKKNKKKEFLLIVNDEKKNQFLEEDKVQYEFKEEDERVGGLQQDYQEEQEKIEIEDEQLQNYEENNIIQGELLDNKEKQERIESDELLKDNKENIIMEKQLLDQQENVRIEEELLNNQGKEKIVEEQLYNQQNQENEIMEEELLDNQQNKENERIELELLDNSENEENQRIENQENEIVEQELLNNQKNERIEEELLDNQQNQESEKIEDQQQIVIEQIIETNDIKHKDLDTLSEEQENNVEILSIQDHQEINNNEILSQENQEIIQQQKSINTLNSQSSQSNDKIINQNISEQDNIKQSSNNNSQNIIHQESNDDLYLEQLIELYYDQTITLIIQQNKSIPISQPNLVTHQSFSHTCSQISDVQFSVKSFSDNYSEQITEKIIKETHQQFTITSDLVDNCINLVSIQQSSSESHHLIDDQFNYLSQKNLVQDFYSEIIQELIMEEESRSVHGKQFKKICKENVHFMIHQVIDKMNSGNYENRNSLLQNIENLI